MDSVRPYVMTVAGFDPSAGAGILADIKTFEQNGVYGIAVCSGITLQTEDEFISMRWTETDELLEHVRKMVSCYPVKALKIGIMPSFQTLDAILSVVHEVKPEVKIVIDPVIRSTTGFGFISEIDRTQLASVLRKASLITPNYQETLKLSGMHTADDAGRFLSEHCAVLIKGGHNEADAGTDYLYVHGSVIKIKSGGSPVYPKHGSGCVLSSAITARLALGDDIETACRKGKIYVEKFLSGNEQLLGYHV